VSETKDLPLLKDYKMVAQQQLSGTIVVIIIAMAVQV
jgi:hypothetical protein